MKDDVTDIPVSGCNVLSSNTTLSNYSGRTRIDYIFNGGKWYKYRTQTSTYSDYDISPYHCIDVSTLNSYAIYTPYIYFVGFMLFAFSLILFFKTIKGFMYGIK